MRVRGHQLAPFRGHVAGPLEGLLRPEGRQCNAPKHARKGLANSDRTITDEESPSPAVERFAARKTDPKAVPALAKDRRRSIIAGVVDEARGGRD